MCKKIILIILLLISVAILTKITCHRFINEGNSSNYEPEEAQVSVSQKLSPVEIVNSINQLADEYNTYVTNNFDKISKNYPKNTKTQDKLYSDYLRQIVKYSELLNNNLEIAMFELSINRAGMASIYKDEVGYRFEFSNNNEDVSGEIFNPVCPVLKMIHIGEGYFTTSINYDYLVKNKSKLGAAMQEYLNLRQKEQKALNNQDLWLDGGYITVSMSTLTDWIIMWQDFLSKNPKFYLKDIIEHDICRYAYYFAVHDYYPNATEVSVETQKAYEDFLQKVKFKKTEAYAFVKRCYEMLEMNNFQYTEYSLYSKEVSIYRNKHHIPAMY